MIDMAKSHIQAGDETDIGEITISTDGRVFRFRTSEPLLDLFAELGWRDHAHISPMEVLEQAAINHNGLSTADELKTT